MDMEKNIEKKDYVFVVAPVVQDVAIEFGIDDPETINCMYEVFKRVTGFEKEYADDDDIYRKGYREGYNDAMGETSNMIDNLAWEIGRLKKN